MKDGSLLLHLRAVDASCLTPRPCVTPPSGQCWKDQIDHRRSPHVETGSGGRAWLGPVRKRQLVQRSLRRLVLQIPFCSKTMILYLSVLKFSFGSSFSLLRLDGFLICFSHTSNCLLKQFLMVTLKILSGGVLLYLSGNKPNWYPWGRRFHPWPCSVG